MENKKINVTVMPDDNCRCQCGCEFFIPCYSIAKVKNPLIGQRDLIIPSNGPIGFICSSCGEAFDPDKIKTIKEINDEKVGNNIPKIIVD